MDKENDGKKSNEELLSGITAGDIEQGNSQGFSPRTVPEADPVRVLQLSESFFVADTCEDDESMMIPPTQEMLIPSTPPRGEASDKEGNISNGANDTTLSNLDETCMEDLEKEDKQGHEIIDISTQNDMTQDIPELDETQQILGVRAVPVDLPKEDHEVEKEVDDDDDWNLRFSETQETQELMSSVQMRELKEQKESSHLSAIAEEEKDDFLKLDSNPDKHTDSPKLESKDSHDVITPIVDTSAKEIEEESEDEIEPSQSCLSEYSKDTYSAFRDQLTHLSMEPPTAHSTPDNTLTEGKTCTNLDAGVPSVPSPIVKPNENQTSNTAMSESTETTKSVTIEEKSSSNMSVTDKEVEIVPHTIEVLSQSEDNPPVLVLDTEPEERAGVSDMAVVDEKDEKQTEVVCDTIELISTVGDTVDEDTKQEVTVIPIQSTVVAEPEKEEHMEVVEENTKVPKTVISSEGPELDPCVQSSGEAALESKKDDPGIEDLPDTLPTTFLPPLPPLTSSRLSRKQKFEKEKKLNQTSHFEKPIKAIGTFKDAKSLEKIFNSFGILLGHERSEGILSLKPTEEVKVIKSFDFTIKDNRIFLEESIKVFPSNDQHSSRDHAVSPHSGSSSSTTNTASTITSTSLHSGEMADISTSSSAKSANSSGMQLDTTVQSSQSSQEQAHKTSTQNSEQQNSFMSIFEQKNKDTKPEDKPLPRLTLSPIKLKEVPQETAAGSRKRGGRKAAAPKPNSKAKAAAKPNNKAPAVTKRKRGRAAKEKPNEETTTEGDQNDVANLTSDVSVERPRKTRRRKADSETSVKTPPANDGDDVQEVLISESSGDAYTDSPYGSIIPGVRVMARWKDGYYYPGQVVSQELEGRWSVRFDDNDIKAIPQENLIKVAILEKGTSVLVQSPDDYYDPGIVCGHFRESNSVGYEVELDNGVTKRYPRTSVILSTDQARLLTSSRPPTTPATMTINLDNIIDGKRKRKSIQSPERNPAVKKSPRISQRIAKMDPNLDSTAESSATDKDLPSRVAESTETEEEPVPKQRNTRKRKAAKAGATKITQVLAPQSGTKHPKLFKDYAFLLTNADRKPKIDTSDSDLTEDEQIIPFDKDQLVHYILAGGGTILEKFDDVQKCKKKNIYLLANTYLRTMKYIQCIAAGIPCIKHHWVQNCCFKGEILNLNSYQLPAGKSLITDKIVEWHGKNDVLKGVKISLISAPENPFVYTWAPVLLAAKADFVQKWSLPYTKSGACLHVDVLVTNPHCPPDVLQSARRRKIPTVSSEWIIQSLIAGNCLPYEGHPKFKYDFTE